MKLKYRALITEDEVNASLALIRKNYQREKLLKLLSNLKITISDPYKDDICLEYKIWITNKQTKRRIYLIESRRVKNPYEITLVDILERIRHAFVIPDSFEEYCDMVIGADESKPGVRFDFQACKRRTDWVSKVITRAESTSIPSDMFEIKYRNPDMYEEERQELREKLYMHISRRNIKFQDPEDVQSSEMNKAN